MRRQGSGALFGNRTLWLSAAVLAATWVSQLRADEAGQSPGASTRPGQTQTSPQLQPAQEATDAATRGQVETLARELAVTKADLDTLLKLLNRACPVEPPGAPPKLAANQDLADLRNSLHAEHDRAGQLEQDLAAARRDVETQTALAAKASDEASQLRTTADASSADLRKSLQQEHDRANQLEQDLAAARRDVETQTALAAKAGDETKQMKKTMDASSAALQKSVQQERDRASRLEQDLATARRDVETQTALATKVSAEASRQKKAADADAADLQDSLQQEQERASRLGKNLRVVRRKFEKQIALAAKAADEASQFKVEADAGAADLRKSLQQERERAKRLEQDLAVARRDVETQTARATKASTDAGQQKKVADEGATDLRRSLQEERERAARLEQDLATARYNLETQTELAAKAGDQLNQARSMTDGSEDLRKALQQEHDRTSRLEQDLTAAQRDVEAQTALAAKSSDEASQAKKTAYESADLRKSLQQERDRTSRLEQDLATSRRDVEAQAALAAKASEEAKATKKTADAASADLRKSLQQERDRTSRLEQDLATSRRDVEAQVALAAKSNDEASQAKKTAHESADLRKSLQQEHDRTSRLEQDLAASRRDVEAQTTLAAKASEEAKATKKTADTASADLRKLLQQERDRAAQLERDLTSAQSTGSVAPNAPQPARAANSVATRQMPPPDTTPKPGDASEVARLVAYARLLLGRGDIGSARIVLQRATETGSAEASFALAETYDPLILSKWGTYGTHGDANRAIDLYARALAGGINEAKERSDALHR